MRRFLFGAILFFAAIGIFTAWRVIVAFQEVVDAKRAQYESFVLGQ